MKEGRLSGGDITEACAAMQSLGQTGAEEELRWDEGEGLREGSEYSRGSSTVVRV